MFSGGSPPVPVAFRRSCGLSILYIFFNFSFFIISICYYIPLLSFHVSLFIIQKYQNNSKITTARFASVWLSTQNSLFCFDSPCKTSVSCIDYLYHSVCHLFPSATSVWKRKFHFWHPFFYSLYLFVFPLFPCLDLWLVRKRKLEISFCSLIGTAGIYGAHKWYE